MEEIHQLKSLLIPLTIPPNLQYLVTVGIRDFYLLYLEAYGIKINYFFVPPSKSSCNQKSLGFTLMEYLPLQVY